MLDTCTTVLLLYDRSVYILWHVQETCVVFLNWKLLEDLDGITTAV